MDLSKWEGFCRANGTKPCGKFGTPYGEVFVAEGFRMGEAKGANHVCRSPHYRIIWGITARLAGKGRFDVAKVMDIRASVDSPEERMKWVRKKVDKWIADNVRAGRYTSRG